MPRNNPEGKFKLRRGMGVARSCPKARGDRAKTLANTPKTGTSGTGVPLGTAGPCHMALSCHLDGPATCAGSSGSAVRRGSGSMGLLYNAFFAAFLAFLFLISAKCCSSFRFFNKVPENIKRCYMSKKCAKGGRFDSSLTRST